MKIQVAGLTFISDRNPKIKELRPSGAVSFEKETDPSVLEHDENAVKVMYKGDHIGYVPKSPIAQETALEYGTARIVDYAYYDTDLKWNTSHIGQFQSLTIEIGDVEIDNGRIIGGNYLRVTQFLSYFNASGSMTGLIKWCFKQGTTFEEYEEALEKCAEDGTLMHEEIENYFDSDSWEEKENSYLPKGWDNFVKKYKPEFSWGEERFYDNDLMVTGQPDFAGYIEYKGRKVPCLLDWKSSKRVSTKHEMQISVYAMNSKVDNQDVEGAMVVAFGSDNKQGFTTKWLTRESIESNYLACKYIKKAMECVNCYISNYY